LHGFELVRRRGSHQAWVLQGSRPGSERIVDVNFKRGSYPVQTLFTLIRQSGIPKEDWIT
jgi:predicted RNA binding protein YcfA (HicA-like mRNA interferase family)